MEIFLYSFYKGDVSMHLKKMVSGVGSLVTGVVKDVTTH